MEQMAHRKDNYQFNLIALEITFSLWVCSISAISVKLVYNKNKLKADEAPIVRSLCWWVF